MKKMPARQVFRHFFCFLCMEIEKMPNYYCELCDFACDKLSNWNNHIETKKHQCRENGTVKNIPNFVCIYCNAHYKTSSGLWKHRPKCSKAPKDGEESITNVSSEYVCDMKNMMRYLINENKEFKEIVANLFKNNLSTADTNGDSTVMTYNNVSDNNIITNNSNNNIVTNNSFNLQFYLNETCKNALNINEFIDSIVITLEDLEQTGILGYAEGISRIFIKNLKDIADELWPIHCSDLKRHVIYIKIDGVWNKETECKAILTKAVKQLANKNMVKINDWKKKYPDCDQANSRKNDMYLKIMMNSMCGGSKEETDSNMNKIVNNIAKHSVIDKIKN